MTTVLSALAALAGAMPALMSVMMFDAPGSTSNPWTILLFISTITFPLNCVAAIALSWLLYLVKWPRLACWLTLLPLLNLLLGAVALAGLQLLHGGQFS